MFLIKYGFFMSEAKKVESETSNEPFLDFSRMFNRICSAIIAGVGTKTTAESTESSAAKLEATESTASTNKEETIGERNEDLEQELDEFTKSILLHGGVPAALEPKLEEIKPIEPEPKEPPQPPQKEPVIEIALEPEPEPKPEPEPEAAESTNKATKQELDKPVRSIPSHGGVPAALERKLEEIKPIELPPEEPPILELPPEEPWIELPPEPEPKPEKPPLTDESEEGHITRSTVEKLISACDDLNNSTTSQKKNQEQGI